MPLLVIIIIIGFLFLKDFWSDCLKLKESYNNAQKIITTLKNKEIFLNNKLKTVQYIFDENKKLKQYILVLKKENKKLKQSNLKFENENKNLKNKVYILRSKIKKYENSFSNLYD